MSKEILSKRKTNIYKILRLEKILGNKLLINKSDEGKLLSQKHKKSDTPVSFYEPNIIIDSPNHSPTDPFLRTAQRLNSYFLINN